MSRTYWGTAEGGTAWEASIALGSNWVAASSVTMSPELMVSTALLAALKLPILTVRGLGMSVNSAARACAVVALARSVAANARPENLDMIIPRRTGLHPWGAYSLWARFAKFFESKRRRGSLPSPRIRRRHDWPRRSARPGPRRYAARSR